MIPDMRRLLEQMRAKRPNEPLTAKVMHVSECQKPMNRAAKKVGMIRITHHDLRHLFATRCIETGVDIPTVSRWLGHKDGGALALKVYGHLRDQHSVDMAGKVTFSAPNDVHARCRRKSTNLRDCSYNQWLAKIKAKYSYPWWASNEANEIFWGQANKPVQIVPPPKYLQSAKTAMGREVFEQELAEPQALLDELLERVGVATIEKLKTRFQPPETTSCLIELDLVWAVLAAEMDKANAADRFDNAPTSSNNRNHPLNKTRIYLFSKRGFGMASVSKENRLFGLAGRF